MILFHHAGARRACYPSPINPSFSCQRRAPAISYRLIVRSSSSSPSNPMSEMLEASSILKEGKKPAVCTADELHYVAVPGTEWRLALWRYLPSPKVLTRLHLPFDCYPILLSLMGFCVGAGEESSSDAFVWGWDECDWL